MTNNAQNLLMMAEILSTIRPEMPLRKPPKDKRNKHKKRLDWIAAVSRKRNRKPKPKK